MIKMLFALALLSGSLSVMAQDGYNSSSSSGDAMENKVTGTMPEVNESKLVTQKWRAGLSSGFNSPKGDIGTTAEFGANVGFEPVNHLGLGLDVGSAKLDDNNRNRRTTFLLDALYDIGGDTPVIRTSYIGVGGGPVLLDGKINWTYAPIVGFDVPLSQKSHDFLSLGLNAKYLINTNSPNSLSGSAAVKYWF